MEEIKKEVKKTPRYDYERCEFRVILNGETIHREEIRPTELNKTVFNSLDLVYAINQCADIIEDDLKDKTLQYLEYCAPQFVATRDDIEPWLMKHTKYIEGPSYFVTNDDNKVYCVTDGYVNEYTDKPYNINNFKVDDTKECDDTLKIGLYYRGREKVARSIDLSCYPTFIRKTVDITNSKHRLDVYSPCEFGMCEIFNERESLVPEIKEILLDVCGYSDNDEYKTKGMFGGTYHDFNVYRGYMKNIYAMEAQYKKKTAAYFGK